MIPVVLQTAFATMAVGYFIFPKDEITGPVSRGRQWASFMAGIGTAATFWKIPLAPPEGALEAIIIWLVFTVVLGLLAFIAGVAYQASVKAVKIARSDGPEILGNAIRKTADTTTDMVHRLQDAVMIRRNCPSCNASIAADAKFCPSCGGAFKDKESICHGCGEKLAVNQQFCSYCGKKAASR